MIIKKSTLGSFHENETIMTKTTRDSSNLVTITRESSYRGPINSFKLRLQPIVSSSTKFLKANNNGNFENNQVVFIRKEKFPTTKRTYLDLKEVRSQSSNKEVNLNSEQSKRVSHNRGRSSIESPIKIPEIKPILKPCSYFVNNKNKIEPSLFKKNEIGKTVKFADEEIINNSLNCVKNSQRELLIQFKENKYNEISDQKYGNLCEIISVPSYRNFNIYMSKKGDRYQFEDEDDISKVECKCVCLIV
jgi:hypothetical protein